MHRLLADDGDQLSLKEIAIVMSLYVSCSKINVTSNLNTLIDVSFPFFFLKKGTFDGSES
jgi:hypothetical protein